VNWFDIFVGLLLIASVIQGLVQGFTRLAVSLASTVAGILLGLWFYGVVGSFFMEWVKSDKVAHFIGFVVIFLAVRIAGGLLGWALSKIFKAAGLSWLDRLLGGGFGALRTALVATGIVLILAAFPVPSLTDTVAKARVTPYLLEGARVIAAMAPKELKDGFTITYEELQKLWNHTIHPPEKANV
jgi:membrane protein required for colicin V production